jgi:hypothetical protein
MTARHDSIRRVGRAAAHGKLKAEDVRRLPPSEAQRLLRERRGEEPKR